MIAFAGTTDFYSAAVQVIPVLALVQFIELRGRKEKLPLTLDAFLIWGMVAAAGTGEMVGFRALYFGSAGRTDQWWVIAALIVAGAAAVIPALAPSTIELLQAERTISRLGFIAPCLAIAWLVFAFIAVVHR